MTNLFSLSLGGIVGLVFRLCVALVSHQKSKGHDLEDALDGEDDSESCVQVFEYGLICRRGRVILKIEQQHRGTSCGKPAGVWNSKSGTLPDSRIQCNPYDTSLISPQTCTRQIYRLMEDSSRPINSPLVSAPLICRTIKRVIPLGAAATVNEVILNSSPWTL